MTIHLEEIKEMIKKKLPKDKFDSHEFIRSFAKEFEAAYVGFLSNYNGNNHRTVHSQIANGLRKNMEYLKIQKNGKRISETVFGRNVSNQEWIKIN
tara:strand:- start:603 stop:890 length:288 start_codon:yes stop_codon:yes gene_type:complete